MAEPPPVIVEPVTIENEGGASPIVLLCEHASNHVPAEYGVLGLAPAELERHIAWDPGAAPLARALSARLDAPLLLGGCSRLVIDLNRPLWSPSSILVRSEATDIPGNRDLGPAERSRRAACWFHPFHARVAALLDARRAAGRPAVVVGVHSFTPVFLGEERRWAGGVLFAQAERFGSALVAHLAATTGLVIGLNEPYRIEASEDYTVPVHGDARGLPAVLLEVRNDLLATPAGVAQWGMWLGEALVACLPQAGASWPC